MQSKPKSKDDGLAFGRALQLVLKQCAIYSSSHPSIQQPLQKAYGLLCESLRGATQLTFGFAGSRVLINNLVTTDSSVRGLRQEFNQRGIAGIVLLPALTEKDFARFVGVLATPPKVLSDKGGATRFFEENQVPGARIILSPENSDADLLLDVSGEAILSKMGWEAGRRGEGDAQSAGMRPSALDSELSRAIPFLIGDDLRSKIEAIVDSALSGPSSNAGSLLENISHTLQLVRPTPADEESGNHEAAREMLEDVAARWAVGRLSVSKSPAEVPNVYEGVVAQLSRALVEAVLMQHTLEKVARLSEQEHLERTVLELVRRELQFWALSLHDQKEQLLHIKRYSATEFRQLLMAIKALMQRGDAASASALANNFIAVLGEQDVTTEELSRAADLWNVMLECSPTDFFAQFGRLAVSAFSGLLDSERHQRLAHLLGIEGARALEAQDWDALSAIVCALDDRLPSEVDQASCCLVELQRLEKKAGLEDTLEAVISQATLHSSTRESLAMCRAFGPRSAEVLFQRLTDEENAGRRLRLVRMISQSGESAIRAARSRINDSRWYVVRNACTLLGDLNDPDLLAQVTPALTHKDERVQMSAVCALVRKHAHGREQILAEGLLKMHPHAAEVALDELLLMRNPKCLRGLREFLMEASDDKRGLLMKAVQVVSMIKSKEAQQLLQAVAADARFPAALRNSASLAL